VADPVFTVGAVGKMTFVVAWWCIHGSHLYTYTMDASDGVASFYIQFLPSLSLVPVVYNMVWIKKTIMKRLQSLALS
jgi:hypothetical protein